MRILGLAAIALALVMLWVTLPRADPNSTPGAAGASSSGTENHRFASGVHLGDGQYGSTGNTTQALIVRLAAGQAIVGQSYGFQGINTGCQVWLVAGPFADAIRVTDGEYFIFADRRLRSDEEEALLMAIAQKQVAQDYGCTGRNQRISRLGG